MASLGPWRFVFIVKAASIQVMTTDAAFTMKTNLHGPRAAIVDISEKGACFTGIFNPHQTPITITKGTKVGMLQALTIDDTATAQINTINPEDTDASSWSLEKKRTWINETFNLKPDHPVLQNPEDLEEARSVLLKTFRPVQPRRHIREDGPHST